RLGACRHGLVGDVTGRDRDVRQPGLLRLGSDPGWRHVSGADDLLLLEAGRDRRASVDSHHNHEDAERHEHQASNEPTDFECLAHLKLPFLEEARSPDIGTWAWSSGALDPPCLMKHVPKASA